MKQNAIQRRFVMNFDQRIYTMLYKSISNAIWSFTNIYHIWEIALIILPSPPITMKNKIL